LYPLKEKKSTTLAIFDKYSGKGHEFDTKCTW